MLACYEFGVQFLFDLCVLHGRVFRKQDSVNGMTTIRRRCLPIASRADMTGEDRTRTMVLQF